MKTYYISIDSKFRDIEKYPNRNYFVFDFGISLFNIISVDLAYASFNSETMNNRYINIFIKEFDSNALSNINNDSFGQIHLINYGSKYVEHMPSKFRIGKTFYPKLSKINKLTIQISDENSLPLELNDDFYLRFEINCEENQLTD
jgi:hypothetical protein